MRDYRAFYLAKGQGYEDVPKLLGGFPDVVQDLRVIHIITGRDKVLKDFSAWQDSVQYTVEQIKRMAPKSTVILGGPLPRLKDIRKKHIYGKLYDAARFLQRFSKTDPRLEFSYIGIRFLNEHNEWMTKQGFTERAKSFFNVKVDYDIRRVQEIQEAMVPNNC